MDEPKTSYLILFKGAEDSRLPLLSEAERIELMVRWNAWLDGLVKSGVAKGGARLGPDGRTVRSSPGGALRDGPFVETKEEIAGYFHILAASLDEAVATSLECPGLVYGMPLDVRPVSTCA